VEIRLEDEDAHVESAVGDPKELLWRLSSRGDLRQTHCLQFIDPYGDTLFNVRQFPGLIEELRSLSPLAHTPEERHLLQAVLQLVQKAQESGPHLYIRFFGD
jgi:hypothetical protein